MIKSIAKSKYLTYLCVNKKERDMAKYTVTYKCGCTKEIQLFGKLSDREKRIAWLETQECPECSRKEETERAKSLAGSLPALEGSEKQIAWAMSIRQRWIDEAQKELASRGLDYAESVEKILAGYQANKDKFEQHEERCHPISFEWRLLTANIETNSKFFIENR